MLRVDEVGGLDHIVLLVALDPVLRAEGGGEVEVGQRGEGVETVRQVGGDRGGMGEQGDAAAGERAAQFRFGEQAVDTEADGGGHGWSGSINRVKASRRWKSGRSPGWCKAQ